MALTTPIMIANSSFLAYYLFAGCTLACTVVIAFFMFETRGQSLEEIERKYSADRREKSARPTTANFRLCRLRMNEV